MHPVGVKASTSLLLDAYHARNCAAVVILMLMTSQQHYDTQKRHPKSMTPYKSMSKWVCDRMGAQAHRTHGDFPPLQSMVGYDCRHLLALLCHDPVSRNARPLEKPSSPPPLLAALHASPLPRAENLGRACPLAAGLDHGLALAPRPQGGLLEYPSADSVVGPGSLPPLATAQGRHPVSWGGW